MKRAGWVVCIVALASLAQSSARADLFHGLNAGAPVWNGSVVLTPQKAAAFAATGTQSIRVNFRLDSGATSWNATQLAMYDQVIANARGAGLDVLGLFSNETVAGGQVAWNDDPDQDGLNSYVSQYASTAQLLVDRYQNDVQQWEIWNEPNAWTNPAYASDPQNAGGTYILPRVYARLLSETYRALDDALLVGPAAAKLATGGLLAHDIGGSFSTSMDYMQQVYNRSSVWDAMEADYGRRYPWDDFGYHFYVSQGSAVPIAQLNSYFNAVRSTQSTNGDAADVVITEFGWQTVGTNTQELQRDNMATAYGFLESRPYISGTYWYQWTDDGTGAWGIVDGANQPKLSYDEFAARNGATGGPNLRATTEHATTEAGLSIGYSNDDLLETRIPTVLAGDLGWHSANPASSDANNPNGLAAFTDGVGDLGSGVTGLLNDFPAAGSPAKLVDYDLESPHDIDEIRIFTGNNGQDGRIFSTTAVWTSSDGLEFDLLGYFQSDPSGAVNDSGTPGGPNGATVVRIFHEDGTSIAEGVTHLRFDFYAVANLQGTLLDPFNGVNTFTGFDDGLEAAYVSPLVREIDVLGTRSVVLPGDYDGNQVVDAADYVKWKETFGSDSDLAADGNGNGIVDAADYTIWRDNLSGTGANSATNVPEPASWLLLAIASAFAKQRGRRANGPPPSNL
jgi:hypothetical protein